MLTTVLCSVAASSGFWAYVMKKYDKKDAETELLIGLAHDRIMYLGDQYIERGWVSRTEYENISEYLFKPYRKAGGNGTAEKMMTDVDKLPIHNLAYKEENHNYHVGGEIT